MATNPDSRWKAAFQNPELHDALVDMDRTLFLGEHLQTIACDDKVDEDVRYLAGLLATIAWFWPNGDDWTNPYGAFTTSEDPKSPIPADFTEEDIAVLAAIAEVIPDLILRSRVFDVLAITGASKLRPKRHALQLQALVDHGVTDGAMTYFGGQWDRGLAVGVRFRSVVSTQLDEIERQLVEAATTSSDGALSVNAARMLSKHRLGYQHAAAIASHLSGHAAGIESIGAQQTLEVAAEWYRRAGEAEAAEDVTYMIVQRFIAEADATGAFRASIHLETALKTLRTIPRTARERLGASGLTTQLAQRIRESGAAALSEMQAVTTEGIDLTEQVTELLAAIRSDDPIESVRRFANFQPFTNLSKARKEAEDTEREFPLVALMSRRTLSSDGRTVYRSPTDGGVTIYGEKASTWQQMIRNYHHRVNLLGAVVLPKAWRQLSTDHRLHIGDFETLAAGSPIVPSTQERIFARGMHYGYSGDFGTAVHLLVPALEALVRLHLANAGERTSMITPDGNESELGLSTLMENERTVDIFGENVAFELRALLCGPIGPNLRNEVSHGLIGDSVFSSGVSVYLWWLTLKLVFLQYWNARHDTEAAEAREPGAPSAEAD